MRNVWRSRYYDVMSCADGPYPEARVSDGNRTVGLAVSWDGGLTFTKSMVGVRDLGGDVGRNNNVVFPLERVRFGSFSVWRDDGPSAAGRLTMLAQYDGPGGYGIYFLTSEEGVRWKLLSDTPAWNHGRAIPGGGPGGTGLISDESQAVAQWDAQQQRYHAYRQYAITPPGKPPAGMFPFARRKCESCAGKVCGTGTPAKRFVARCTSAPSDITRFPNCTGKMRGTVVFAPDMEDNPCCDIYLTAFTEYDSPDHQLIFP